MIKWIMINLLRVGLKILRLIDQLMIDWSIYDLLINLWLIDQFMIDWSIYDWLINLSIYLSIYLSRTWLSCWRISMAILIYRIYLILNTTPWIRTRMKKRNCKSESRPNQHNFQILIFFRISVFISGTLDLFPESLVYLSGI